MKSLIVLGIIMLTAEAAADRRVYDVKAVSAGPSGELSCGATKRMLRDRHIFTVVDRKFWVDGFRWNTWFDDNGYGETTIGFHDGTGQKTYLVMDLEISDRNVGGQYILYGRTLDGKECSDSVNIFGTRR